MDYVIKCNSGEACTRLLNRFYSTIGSTEIESVSMSGKTVHMKYGDRFIFVSAKAYDNFMRGRRCPTISDFQFEIMIDLYQKGSDEGFDGISKRVLSDSDQGEQEN